MSFREMRRFRQQLSLEECQAVLDRGTSGVLAVTGDEGWPYAVPLSYVREGKRLLFHCATAGHKLDALRMEPRACFCVIDRDQIVPEEFTTYYRSVVIFGSVRILDDPAEITAAARTLAGKYCPREAPQAVQEEIDGALHRMYILEMTVKHMTGKEARELMEGRSR